MAFDGTAFLPLEKCAPVMQANAPLHGAAQVIDDRHARGNQMPCTTQPRREPVGSSLLMQSIIIRQPTHLSQTRTFR